MARNRSAFLLLIMTSAVGAWQTSATAASPSASDPTVPVAARPVPIGSEAASKPPLVLREARVRPNASAASTRSTRQCGQGACDLAQVINALPFSDVGDTREGTNSIESPNCEDTDSEAPDVAYKYTPAVDQVISITTCNSSSAGTGHDDTRLLVFAGDCDPASEYACNNDSVTSCSHNIDSFAQAEIPALAVTGGVDYYIVVDGFDGAAGVFTIDVAEVPTGACCEIVGGQTCTEDTSALDCSCLADLWTQGGSCVTPVCQADPVHPDPSGTPGLECPADTIFGPGFHSGDGNRLWIIPADDQLGTSHADGFWNLAQPIKYVAWWGVYSISPGLGGPCDKPGDNFNLTFYSDDCGAPGNAVAGPFVVHAQRAGSGFIFPNVTSQIYRFVAPLPVSVSLSTGWVGISARVDDAADDPNCTGRVLAYFDQPTQPAGDGKSWAFGAASPIVSGDMLDCISSPSLPGACCDDLTDTCSDGVAAADCEPPSRFVEEGLCASLNPPCGEGACCTADGECALTDQAGCAGSWRPGVLCEFANCPPSNDNCASVIPETGGPPYLFTNRTTGATSLDCPTLGSASGWEAFTTTSCLDLRLDYCGTSPPFVGDAAGMLLDACCSLLAKLGASNTTTTARVGACCIDEFPGYEGNISMEFWGVPAGSWYYPVFSGGGSLGDYVINVSGSPVSPGHHSDHDRSGIVDLADYPQLHACLSGALPDSECACLIDHDQNGQVDLRDYARFQEQRLACTSCSGVAEAAADCACANDDCAGAQSISCGQTVCGIAGTGDQDWYQINVTQNSTIQWTATAEFPTELRIYDATIGCLDDMSPLTLASGQGNACSPASISVCVSPGNYLVSVGAQEGVSVPCGSPYRAQVTCTPGCTPPGLGACCTFGGCVANRSEQACQALDGHYQGNGSSCGAGSCPIAPGDECATAMTVVTGGSYIIRRSDFTANPSDPLGTCESAGAKDASIWFKWTSPAIVSSFHLDLCCDDSGALGDTVITVFASTKTGQTCENILATNPQLAAGCNDDSGNEDCGAGSADVCLTGSQGILASRLYYFLVKIKNAYSLDEDQEFTLHVTNTCTAFNCPAEPVCTDGPIACPPGAVQENEPDCMTDYEDVTNNGCSPGNPQGFQPIACGQTICGETGNYDSNGAGGPDPERDRDWFAFTLTEETQLDWAVQAAGAGATAPGITAQIWRIQGGCDQNPATPEQELDNRSGVGNDFSCEPVVASAVVEAGQYAVTVFGRSVNLDPDPGDQPCGTPWIGTLTCQRADILATPDDACGAAPTLTAGGRYSGIFGTPLTQTADGESTCDGVLGDEGFCDGPAQRDIYWKYTASCTGKTTFEVRRGVAPLVLSAHSGCPATCDNELPGGLGFTCTDFGGGPSLTLPKLVLDVRAGVTYVIRLASSASDGPYELLVSDCVDCCDPLPFPECPVCGNGELEGAEECDDGNNNGGDGCDAFCRTE